MNQPNESNSRSAHEILSISIEYTNKTGDHRTCFYLTDASIDRVEQAERDGQWYTIGREQLERLTIQIDASSTDISTQREVDG
jgi:hypothetical protein